MKVEFNDSHESDGFEKAIDAVNNLLKYHNLKVNKIFTEENAEFEWELKLAKLEGK
mgnify:CR=1 FL=1